MVNKHSKQYNDDNSTNSEVKGDKKNSPIINKEIKEKNKLYLQKWTVIFSLSLFFIFISIFLVVVENNSFSGYNVYARQQYKRSISNLQKSFSNLSSFINQSNNDQLERQKRSDIPTDDSQYFTLSYPFHPIVLALDSVQDIIWESSSELKDKKMDIVLKSTSGSNEETIIAENIQINSNKFTWDIDYSVQPGTYNIIFKEKKNNNVVYLSTSPNIIILSLNTSDKNFYPKLIKFTYPFAPMEWRLNDNSIVTWNPLPFAKFSTTFKLSICELVTKENNVLEVSEILIHPEVQASNGYFKVNLKNIKGVSSGKQYFFKASFLSGVFEISSLFTAVDDNLETTNYSKGIQIATPFTSTSWNIEETVNISLNIKRFAKDNLKSTYLRLSSVDINNNSNNNNFENTFITQFSSNKRKNNNYDSATIKIKDIKSLEDSQVIWKVPKNIKIGYYSIQIVKVDENNNESIIDQTSPIIEIIP